MNYCMHLNTSVIYFPDRNKNMCTNLSISEKEYYAFQNAICWLCWLARPCSSASRMWRGHPPPGCLHALRILLPLTQKLGRGADPAGRPSSSPYACILHLPSQGPGSRQFTNPWSYTLRPHLRNFRGDTSSRIGLGLATSKDWSHQQGRTGTCN